MELGASVEIFSRFDRSWVRGFQLVDEARDDAGRVTARTVRRMSDRMVLPWRFPGHEVREVRSTDTAPMVPL